MKQLLDYLLLAVVLGMFGLLLLYLRARGGTHG